MNHSYDVTPTTRRAMTLLIKPSSGNCNMRCSYCFYADEMANREIPSYGFMDEKTLEAIVEKSLHAVSSQVNFAFQGGEPTLIGLDFYKKFIDYKEHHAKPGITTTNAIQTDGFTLDEEWSKFLGEHKFLVGLSIDGTKKIHDAYRKDAAGEDTLTRVLQSASYLKQYHVDFNILTVVTGKTADAIERIYRFFQKRGFTWQQYIPCLDPLHSTPGTSPYSLSPQQYGDFLCRLFDLWYEDFIHGTIVYIRQFENLLGILKGYPPESCDMGGTCSEQWVIEANGDVYPCDFYVLDEWKLGNIRTDSFTEMNKRRHELAFIQASTAVPAKCRACRWYGICRNGCRRNRLLEQDNLGLNYFCPAYQQFFEYAHQRLAAIADTL